MLRYVAVQRVGKIHPVALTQWCRAATVNAAGAHGFKEIAHVEAGPHIGAGVEFTAGI